MYGKGGFAYNCNSTNIYTWRTASFDARSNTLPILFAFHGIRATARPLPRSHLANSDRDNVDYLGFQRFCLELQGQRGLSAVQSRPQLFCRTVLVFVRAAVQLRAPHHRACWQRELPVLARSGDPRPTEPPAVRLCRWKFSLPAGRAWQSEARWWPEGQPPGVQPSVHGMAPTGRGDPLRHHDYLYRMLTRLIIPLYSLYLSDPSLQE